MDIKKHLINKEIKRHLKVSKGYRLLRELNQLDFLDNLKIQFAETPLVAISNSSKFIIIDSKEVTVEIAIRQFVLQRFIGINFNKEILSCLADKTKKFNYPLPLEWQNIISSSGIKVNKIGCNFFWLIEMFKLWLYAGYEFLKQFFFSLRFNFSLKENKKKKFIYFDSLGDTNIPNESGHYKYGILTWFLNLYKPNDIDYFAHGCSTKSEITLNEKICVKYLRSPILPPFSLVLLLLFVVNSIYRLFFSLIFLFCGSWWRTILLRDSLLVKIISLNKGKGIALNYLFHNSGWIYRPLWTYTAEKYYSEIIFYFYSTNVERFKKPKKDNPIVNSWNLVSWPNYLVWDKFQSDFIKKVSNVSFLDRIVGPISFVCSDLSNLSLPHNFIAVFDVQPVRETYYNSLGLDQEYYIPEVANAFLSDIFEAISSKNVSIALKRKRNIGKLVHSKYLSKLGYLNEYHKFIDIEPSTPAEYIIENCNAVISMPFTSTALIGVHFGKPSIYYDPSGLIMKDDPAAHGVEIISGLVELKLWIKNLNIYNNE